MEDNCLWLKPTLLYYFLFCMFCFVCFIPECRSSRRRSPSRLFFQGVGPWARKSLEFSNFSTRGSRNANSYCMTGRSLHITITLRMIIIGSKRNVTQQAGYDVYIYLSLSLYIYIYMYECVYIYIYTHTHMHIHICMYEHIYIDIYSYICMYVYVCIYIYICMYNSSFPS